MIDQGLRALLKGLVRLYQLILSPILPNMCRFTPSCSHYAILALDSFSTPRALWLIITRLLRCNPLFKSGYDPLPNPAGRRN